MSASERVWWGDDARPTDQEKESALVGDLAKDYNNLPTLSCVPAFPGNTRGGFPPGRVPNPLSAFVGFRSLGIALRGAIILYPGLKVCPPSGYHSLKTNVKCKLNTLFRGKTFSGYVVAA